MKKIISFVFSVGLLFAAEGGTKEVDLGKLFKQLDGVIAAKKDDKKISEDKQMHDDDTTLKREQNYQKFNEAAKKHHIYRAEKILNTVKELKVEYKKLSHADVMVQRYSAIGEKKFAYVSSLELSQTLKTLKENGKTISKLTNFEKLLTQIGEFDIKTISKVLIIVEQEVMNLRDMGIKKVLPELKKELSDMPILLKMHKRFENVEVTKIEPDFVTLKVQN